MDARTHARTHTHTDMREHARTHACTHTHCWLASDSDRPSSCKHTSMYRCTHRRTDAYLQLSLALSLAASLCMCTASTECGLWCCLCELNLYRRSIASWNCIDLYCLLLMLTLNLPQAEHFSHFTVSCRRLWLRRSWATLIQSKSWRFQRWQFASAQVHPRTLWKGFSSFYH